MSVAVAVSALLPIVQMRARRVMKCVSLDRQMREKKVELDEGRKLVLCYHVAKETLRRVVSLDV
jgi:hypothetical protein